MPITKKQREQRRKYIGASDVPALLGVDPFKTAADVYHSKLGNLVDKDDDDVSAAIEAGNYLEPSILAWASNKLGKPIRRNQRRVKGFFAASLDAVLVGVPEALEAKTTGLYNPMFFGEEWGSDGSDEVPMRVMAQAQAQMFVADLERVWVPALINGRGLSLFRLERDEEIISQIERVGTEFWEDCVLRKVPPPDVLPSLSTLKRLTRVPEKVADIEARTMARYLNAKDEVRRAEAVLKEAQAALLNELGDAEQGESDAGIITYFEQTQDRVDTKALREKYPDIAKEVEKRVSFRVLREKKSKPKDMAV